jgi:hypothetical protein
MLETANVRREPVVKFAINGRARSRSKALRISPWNSSEQVTSTTP